MIKLSNINLFWYYIFLQTNKKNVFSAKLKYKR